MSGPSKETETKTVLAGEILPTCAETASMSGVAGVAGVSCTVSCVVAAAFLGARGLTRAALGDIAAGGATSSLGGVARGARFRLVVAAPAPSFEGFGGCGSPDVSGVIWYGILSAMYG